MIGAAIEIHLETQVDSKLETTRVFWRTKFFNATPAEAFDPRPFEQVLADRQSTVITSENGK